MFSKLKDVRIAQGKTCEELSVVLGLKTRGAYHKKENGTVPFTLEEASAVAQHLGKSVSDLFFDNEVSKMDTRERMKK